MKKEFITVEQASELSGVSRSTIYFWVNNKKYFKVTRLGWKFRIDKKSFKDFLKKSGL